jgi:hypothetical protein
MPAVFDFFSDPESGLLNEANPRAAATSKVKSKGNTDLFIVLELGLY